METLSGHYKLEECYMSSQFVCSSVCLLVLCWVSRPEIVSVLAGFILEIRDT